MKYLHLTLFLIFWIGSQAIAQSNGFDLSFGNNGIVITGTNESVYGSGAIGEVVVQSDGKILAAGGGLSCVIRYMADGSIDHDFGDQGLFHMSDFFSEVPFVFYDIPSIMSLVLQPDGKIVVGGSVDTVLTPGDMDYFACRLNMNGTLDSSFGYQGHVICDLDGRLDNMTCMTLQPDGKILMAGYCRVWNSTIQSTRNEIGIVRLMPDGAVDTTFGVSGWAHRPTTNTSYGSRLFGLDLMPDGRIVVGGDTYVDGTGELSFYTARFLANGLADSSFNHDGLAVISGLGDFYCHGLALQPDGKVIMGGESLGLNHLRIVRWNVDGTLDTSFNGTGTAPFSNLGNNAKWWTIKLMNDGKILAAGSTEMPDKRNFIIIRVNPNGTLDTTFGDDGKLVNMLRIGGDEIYDLAIQPDGKILAAGSSIFGTGDWPDIYTDWAIVRYNPDGALPVENLHLTDIAISIFPNPAINDIQILNPGKLHIDRIRIIAGDGRLIQEYGDVQHVNVSHLASGKYYLAISLDDTVLYKPFVIGR